MNADAFEWREHVKIDGRHEHGRTTCRIVCPFCKAETEAFVWSLAGGGKRCSNRQCGAVHASFRQSRRDPNFKPPRDRGEPRPYNGMMMAYGRPFDA